MTGMQRVEAQLDAKRRGFIFQYAPLLALNPTRKFLARSDKVPDIFRLYG